MFTNLDPLPCYHLTDFEDSLCIAISNVCSGGLRQLFPDDVSGKKLRLFSTRAVSFITMSMRCGFRSSGMWWDDYTSLFPAMHNLVRRSPTNRLRLARRKWFCEWLILCYTEIRDASESSDPGERPEWETDGSINKLIRVLFRDRSAPMRSLWTNASVVERKGLKEGTRGSLTYDCRGM